MHGARWCKPRSEIRGDRPAALSRIYEERSGAATGLSPIAELQLPTLSVCADQQRNQQLAERLGIPLRRSATRPGLSSAPAWSHPLKPPLRLRGERRPNELRRDSLENTV